MSQQTSSDGEPLNAKQYAAIMRECTFLSDQLHTPINEILDLATKDRRLMFDYVQEKQEVTKKAIDDAKAARQH